MATNDLCTQKMEATVWGVEVAGEARFNWEYDEGRERLLSLYQKGKDRQ